MARGVARRRQISEAFAALHGAVGQALGAAAGYRDAAVRAHVEAMVEMWLREDGSESAATDPALRGLLTNPRLAAPVDRLEADRRAAFSRWLSDGPERLSALLAEAAPGIAGPHPPAGWPDGPVDRAETTGVLPQLWYVGDGRIGDRPTGGF